MSRARDRRRAKRRAAADAAKEKRRPGGGTEADEQTGAGVVEPPKQSQAEPRSPATAQTASSAAAKTEATRPEATQGAKPRPAPARRWSASGVPPILRDAGIAIGVFILASLIAALLGAANAGVALGVGQVAFMAAIVLLMLRR